MMSGARIACAIAALLALAAPTPAAPNPARIQTMTQDTQQAAAEMKTWCFGRFLIDLPAGATLAGGQYKYDFAQIDRPEHMSPETFEKRVAQRETELRESRHQKEPSLLRATLRPNNTTRILSFWKNDYSSYQVRLEGFRWIGETLFRISDKADTSKQDLALKLMGGYLSRLRPRADDEIPAEPGYCFEGGFIADSEWRNEHVGIDFDLPGLPDAVLSITIFPLAKSRFDKPLLERQAGVLQQLGSFATGLRTLRRGERRIGPFKGQESLVTGPNSGGHRGHVFTWETQGEGTLERPFIEIELQTGRSDGRGNAQQARLSDEEAMRLWDAIVGTLRIRPTRGPDKTGEAPPAPAPGPLGTLAATGRACPQAGLWQAEEGEQRFLREGEKMPRTEVPHRPSLLDRLRGRRRTISVATLWKLVAYGQGTDGDSSPIKATGITDSSSRDGAAEA